MPEPLRQPSASGYARRDALATFLPGHFALVMATGIVSLAAQTQGMRVVAQGLLWLNVAAYCLLACLTLARLALRPAELIREVTHHARGVNFLTMVAGTCVLGAQFASLTSWGRLALALWYVSLALWVVLTYTYLVSVTVREPKPTLEEGISGGWLLLVVSTESLCVLGTLVIGDVTSPEIQLFACLSFYLASASTLPGQCSISRSLL